MNTQAKEHAGRAAAAYVQDGMTVGLGTGSTVYWTLIELGERIAEGLQIRGVPTSLATEKLARELKIPLVSLDDVQQIDLTVDGADEIDADGNLIKGGGGALLREKLIAQHSAKYIIVVDGSKRVAELGAFPLPLEVVSFGALHTKALVEQQGCRADLRSGQDGQPFITDNGNYVLDCSFDRIPHPVSLHQQLKQLSGIIETGLFTGFPKTVIVASDDELTAYETK